MPSRRTGILLLVALLGPLLALVGSTPALAEEIVELAETAEASDDGTIRVIVELDTAIVPEGDLTTSAATRQRDRIDQLAAQVLATVDATDVPSVQAVESAPYLIIEATAEGVEDLIASPGVASIIPDRALHVDLNETVPRVQADDVTDAGYTGVGLNVAVLDTGVDSQHEFLEGKVHASGQACFSAGSDCPNSSREMTGAGAGEPCTYSSDCTHGTHVAGIAVGVGSNPARGVATGAGIVPVNVFSQDTNDPDEATAFFSDILLGLDWVYDNHDELDIAAVNMSLGDGSNRTSPCGSSGQEADIKNLVDNLRSVGIPTVISAGNSYHRTGIGSPACISTAISVGATTDASVGGVFQIAEFSNVSSFVSLLAPGDSVRSSVSSSSHDDYATFNGTSMAAPHVAGAWALLRSALDDAGTTPDVTNELAILRSTGISTSDLRLARTYTTAIGSRPAGSVVNLAQIEVADALLSLHPQPGAPVASAVATGSNEVKVSWEDPLWLGASTTIDSYEVTVTSTAGISLPARAFTRAEWLAIGKATVYSDLPRGATYTFSVKGTSVVPAAVSDAGTVSSALAEVPGAPTNVTADGGSSQADVSWTAPGNGGSAITDYKVTVSPATDVTTATIAVGSATTELNFTGLTNGTTYTFTVTAVNAVGESVASAASNEVTPRSSRSSGGGGGGGGGGGSGTTTTTRPRSTTTTTAPAPEPKPAPEPDPVASPGASVGNGNVITIRDGEAVVIPRSAPAGANVVGGAVTPSGAGAWSVTSTGEVFVAGDARDLGDLTGFPLNAPIVGIAPTPSGNGYWLLGRDGGIFSFGNAPFFGSTGAMALNQPVVGMAASESGNGYWLFAGDGGIFTFGDSRFFGSTGALRLNAPVTTMAPTPSGRGYWLLGADGGVFTFGDASFHGSTGGRSDVGAIEAIVPSDTGRGYWLIGNDGRLHTFGDAA